MRRLYDAAGSLQAVPVSGPLAAYIALLHVCGPEAVGDAAAFVESDLFSVWGAAGPELRAVLKREGERVIYPELGTRWPTAA